MTSRDDDTRPGRPAPIAALPLPRVAGGGFVPDGDRSLDTELVRREIVLPRWLDDWLRAEHAACEAAGSQATERFFVSWVLDAGFEHFDRADFVRLTGGGADPVATPAWR